MSDETQEHSSQSWGARIIESLKGSLFGVALFIAAFPLLFWNEGRAVQQAKNLASGASSVIAVTPEKIDPANNEKLVHVSGKVVVGGALEDEVFGVKAAGALGLERRVEMLQWKQSSSSKTDKKMGGGTETVTTYSYTKEWAETPISSVEFKQSAEHVNPPASAWLWRSSAQKCGEARLGAFDVTAQAASLGSSQALPVEAVPAKLANQLRLHEGRLTTSINGDEAQVGDVRISFQVRRPGEASIVARQAGDRLAAWNSEQGQILMVQNGLVPAKEMFKQAESSNSKLTWILRLVGAAVMFFGVMTVLRPLVVLADVVPVFGAVAEFGTGLIAFLVAAPLSLLTMAVAWFFYRPLVSLSLLLVAAAIGVGVWMKMRKPGVAAPAAA
ncbi:MAG: hypothetical protein RL095_1179 [Verrucomicrobiota bacterium]